MTVIIRGTCGRFRAFFCTLFRLHCPPVLRLYQSLIDVQFASPPVRVVRLCAVVLLKLKHNRVSYFRFRLSCLATVLEFCHTLFPASR